jgi:membrane-bound metal-dependent hydrolase YbcI (DUF457 family)
MTGRTHDLAAFTLLNAYFVLMPLIPMTLATFVVTIGANFVGGLAPDLDQSTSTLWKQLRGGRLFGTILSPILGGHRLISHSFVGLGLAGWLFNLFLNLISEVLIVDINIVWWGFMFGIISHLLTDALTREGIPLFFPLPLNFGFPPIKRLRITTGKQFEKAIIYPGLMLLNGYWFFNFGSKYLDFFRNYIQ